MSSSKSVKLTFDSNQLPILSYDNAYATLTTLIDYWSRKGCPGHPYLSERMQAFGSHNMSVPIVLDHSMPSVVSGFSSVYYRGAYNMNKDASDNESKCFPDKMLTQVVPNRNTINCLKQHDIRSLEDLSKLYHQIDLIPTSGPASYSFDEKRVLEYYNTIDSNNYYIDSVLARLVIKSTIQVPFGDILTKIREALNKFVESQLDTKKEFYLFVNDKIGSEHMIMVYLHEDLAKLGIKGIIKADDFKTLTDNVSVIVIDDVLYTGVHILQIFDYIGDDIKTDFKHKIDLHVIVAISTSGGIECVKDLNNMYSFFHAEIYHTNRILNIEELVDLNKDLLVNVTDMDSARSFQPLDNMLI